ncbi:STAS domain-containing protein [Amycolatopsis sp. NPDC059021]|uniref:STAS domain-containing protein n=1 Tax=Amycolatopsis sp. NPDC059021 TaxID=3346704 RepID=UPI00366F272D
MKGYVPFSALTKHVDEHIAEILLSGELDLHASRNLADEVATALAPGPRLLLADLSSLTFIATTGLSALAEARRRANVQHAEMYVHSVSHHAVRRAFEITHAARFLNVCLTRADAIELHGFDTRSANRRSE